MATAPQLTEEVEMAVWGTVSAFVLDLSGRTSLDSSRGADPGTAAAQPTI